MKRVERIEANTPTAASCPAAVMIVPPRTHLAAAPACQPNIELPRDGDIIQAIDVTCTCGQKMRLRCVYEEPAAG
jgi:hypothetical protein